MMLSILLFVLYCLACLCLGVRLLIWLGLKTNDSEQVSSITLLATAELLGGGIATSIWLVLALMGQLSRSAIIVSSIVMILSGIRPVIVLLPFVFSQARKIVFDWLEERWLWKITSAVIAIFVGIFAFSSILQKTWIGDAYAFYLVIAKTMASSQRLTPLPGYEVYSNIPLLGELHFAALLAVGASKVSVVYGYVMAICLSIFLLALARRVGMGRRGQWIALGLLFTSSVFTLLIGDGKVDIFGAAFGLAAFYWAFIYSPSSETQAAALRIIGLLTGFAIVAKFSYLAVLIPSIFVLILWNQLLAQPKFSIRQLFRQHFFNWMQIVLFILIALLPNILKNSLLYQEPFAPLISKGASWLEQNWYSASVARRLVLTYPLALIYGNYFAQYGQLSPLSLVFLPFLFFRGKKQFSLYRHPLFRLSVSALAGVLIWIIFRTTTFAPRYFLSPLLVLLLVGAFAAEYASYKRFKPLRIELLIPLALLFVIYISYDGYIKQFPGLSDYLSGKISRSAYLGPGFDPYNYLNQVTDDGDRIFIDNYYTYWLRPDLIECLDSLEDQVAGLPTAKEKWEKLYLRGFKYVYIYIPTHGNTLSGLEIPLGVPDWLSVTPVFVQGDHQIFELKSKDPNRQPEITCKQNETPAYQLVDSK